MQNPIKNFKKKKAADALILLLVFAMPVAAAFWGVPIWDAFGQNTARLSAAMTMPEAGVDAVFKSMSFPSGESSNIINVGQPSAGILPKEEPIPGLTDVENASRLIPESRRGAIETSRYASHGSGNLYFDYGNGCVWNLLSSSNADMQAAASQPLPFGIVLNSSEPQVLIYHTHSTESFDRFDAGFYDTEYPSRSTDVTDNVNAVGQVMADTLDALGIRTIHATEYHDYPSYNGAYGRSRETVQYYLARYPSIKIVLDIHRDAIERNDGTRIKPTTAIDGKKAAQVMIVCSSGGKSNPFPEFQKNLSFAAHLQDTIETLYPTITRPLKLGTNNYNADLSTGSLLMEIGSHANTLEEAKYSGELVARALARLFSAV